MKPAALKPDAETEFLKGLIELQYGRAVEKRLRNIAGNVSWARGWPENKEAFWNAEAFMWKCKVPPNIRRVIEQELAFLEGGKNLDLGCGAYSYIPTVGIDLSEKMLQYNERCGKKVHGDLEKLLPFPRLEFDSATAILVLNYIVKVEGLLSEIHRVLKDDGVLVAVVWGKRINSWQRQKEVHAFSRARYGQLLRQAGFAVESYSKGGLWFFRCQKKVF